VSRSLVFVLGVVTSVVLAPRIVHADEARVRLALVARGGADECVRRDDLVRDVVARLGRDPFDASALRSIEVVIAVEGAVRTARIYTRDEPAAQPAMRVLSGDDCTRMRTALSLAVALAIDPNAPLAPTGSSPSDDAPQRSAPDRARAATPRTRVLVVDPGSWDRAERVAVRGGAIVGVTPEAAGYVELGFDTARRSLFRGRISALRSFEVRTDDRSFGFTLTAFAAAFCVGAAQSRFAFDACAGVRAGIVTGVVHRLSGLTPRDPGDYPWLAFHLDVSGSFRIADPIALEIGAQPYVTALRQVFTVQRGGTTETVYEQSPVGVFVYGGVRVRFW
jgi:hypothetical protein